MPNYAGGVAGRISRRPPVELVSGWPDEIADDVSVEVARVLCVRLREAMDGRSAREIGRLTDVDFTTVLAILHGTTWPDLMTIARLEAGLQADLWPAGVAIAGMTARAPHGGAASTID